jgi:hypothetical protein
VGHTLLIGHGKSSWREWLKKELGSRDLLCLDPADPTHGPPAKLTLHRGHRPVHSRFYGSLDPQRRPDLMIAATVEALRQAEGDLVVELFPYRASPVLRHAALLVAQILQPEHILVARDTPIDQGGFPVGPHEVELDAAMPPMVQHAQRKAQWMKLLEACEPHTVDLRKVTLEGTRLGCGVSLSDSQRKAAGLETAVHAEAIGGSLLVVTDMDLDDEQIAQSLDYTGCSRAVFVEPGAYRYLLCSFARQDGEEFGSGILTDIDWRSMRASFLCTAVAPAPVRILRLGSLRVDKDARELGELRPWQV